MPRVLVVDDDRDFAEMLALVLEADDDAAVVGVAGNGAEGVELALRLRPDVVLMDVQMPVMDGLEAACRIGRRLRSARVVIITAESDPEVERRARAAGADGFLRKGCGPAELLDAVAGKRKTAPCARWIISAIGWSG